jgi:sugar transferase (PEP-CTERM system associated)
MLRIGGQRIPTATLALFLLDALSVVIALLAAIFLRFHDQRAIVDYLRGPHVALRFLLVVVVCEIGLYYSDMYSRPDPGNRVEILMGLLQGLGGACLVLAFLYYLDDNFSLGRGIAALAGPLILGLTFVSRSLLARKRLFISGPKRVLVVGTGPAGISAVREILARSELNLKVEGFLDEAGENLGKSLVNPGIIGGVQDLEMIAQERQIDRVILSLMERRGRMPVAQLLHLKFAGIAVEDAHSVIEKVTGRIHLEHLSPSWLILSDGFKKSAILYGLKRAFDISLALLTLILTLPVMGLVAIAILIESGRPILFGQERTGHRGRPFVIRKFRSMYQNAEENGPVWAAKGDKRITMVGRLIRRYRLDELPQLFNVVRGDMSLVGPRPERPHFCRLLEQSIPYFSLRHSVRPGITGWAQIKYQYGASVEESRTKLEYDFFYIKHLSLVLDLAILFETAKVMILGRGAK